MPNPYFSFKQFTVYHDRCAMKVGTDGVLLGAWTDVSAARRILDIGTGTGLIAIMLAQRCSAQIKGIDIDGEATLQAQENVARSPWKERIGIEQQDICHYQPQECFDVIVSNPPYFIDSLKCPEKQRNIARHTDTLTFEALIHAAKRLLHPEGSFSVIIPADHAKRFQALAKQEGFHLWRCTWVHGKPDASPKRVLFAFKQFPSDLHTDDLTIELSRHVYSPEYKALTQAFYLEK